MVFRWANIKISVCLKDILNLHTNWCVHNKYTYMSNVEQAYRLVMNGIKDLVSLISGQWLEMSELDMILVLEQKWLWVIGGNIINRLSKNRNDRTGKIQTFSQIRPLEAKAIIVMATTMAIITVNEKYLRKLFKIMLVIYLDLAFTTKTSYFTKI